MYCFFIFFYGTSCFLQGIYLQCSSSCCLKEPFKIRGNLAFGNKSESLLCWSMSCRVDIHGSDWNRDSSLGAIDNGSSYVSTFLVGCAYVFQYRLEGMDISIGLPGVTAIEDVTFEFGTVAGELRGSLSLGLVASSTTATSSTATATCL
jgi:hypothetical protein